MELEFDKEIDAILRKARGGQGAGVTAAASTHLDADSIAAFAENALPQKAKLLYMEHFADCDRCRRLLSQSISLNSEAAPKAASIPVEDAAAEPDVPWYRKFFSTPGLAMAMGAVVLAFSGLLGYIVIQNRNDSSAPELSRAVEKAPVAGGPSYSANIEVPSANAAANSTAAANMPAANSAATSPISMANTASGISGPASAAPLSSADEPNKDDRYADVSREEAKSVAAAPPPPPPISGAQPAATGAGVPPADEKLKKEDADLAVADKARGDLGRTRDLPPSPKKSGPVRSGPANTQQEMNVQAQNSILNENYVRTVGGKSFDRRGGVWYDLAYKGQSTRSISRGSDDYKKLDGGLRGIGDALDGTVVVVWKNKAYRIQ